MNRRSLLKSLVMLPVAGVLSRLSFASSPRRASVDRSTWNEHELQISLSQKVRFRLPDGFFLYDVAGQRMFPLYEEGKLTTNTMLYILTSPETFRYIHAYGHDDLRGDGIHTVEAGRYWILHGKGAKWAGLKINMEQVINGQWRPKFDALRDMIEARAEELLST